MWGSTVSSRSIYPLTVQKNWILQVVQVKFVIVRTMIPRWITCENKMLKLNCWIVVCKKFPSGNALSHVQCVIKETLTWQNWFPFFLLFFFLAEQTFLWICFVPSLLTSSCWPSGLTILVRYSFTSLSAWTLLIKIGTGFSHLSTSSPALVLMILDHFWNASWWATISRVRKWLQKPWTKILLVVNFGSKEKTSNQLKYWEQKKNEKFKDYCKADKNMYWFF